MNLEFVVDVVNMERDRANGNTEVVGGGFVMMPVGPAFSEFSFLDRLNEHLIFQGGATGEKNLQGRVATFGDIGEPPLITSLIAEISDSLGRGIFEQITVCTGTQGLKNFVVFVVNGKDNYWQFRKLFS